MATRKPRDVVMRVSSSLIPQIWHQVWPLLKPAVVLESEGELLAGLIEENRILIVVGDGAAVVRNCGNFVEINYVGGKKVKQWWPQMSAEIDDFSRALGIRKIVALGADAWKKLAPDYTPTKTRMFIKELE
jgi:hypothetical protein